MKSPNLYFEKEFSSGRISRRNNKSHFKSFCIWQLQSSGTSIFIIKVNFGCLFIYVLVFLASFSRESQKKRIRIKFSGNDNLYKKQKPIRSSQNFTNSLLFDNFEKGELNQKEIFLNFLIFANPPRGYESKFVPNFMII